MYFIWASQKYKQVNEAGELLDILANYRYTYKIFNMIGIYLSDSQNYKYGKLEELVSWIHPVNAAFTPQLLLYSFLALRITK